MSEFITYTLLRNAFASSDLNFRRRMIEVGAAFANFSIMTPTEQAEDLLRRWVEKGRPILLDGLSDQLKATREHRLESVARLSDSQIQFLGLMESPNLERIFAQWTWGYGPAKASFAMACAGLGYLPCLDRRLMRKHSIPINELDDWPNYLMWCERLYPGVRDKASVAAQEWLDDLGYERYSTQHEFLLGVPSPQLNFDY